MKHKLLTTTAVSAVLAATGYAYAEGVTLKVFGGLNFAGDESFDGKITTSSFSGYASDNLGGFSGDAGAGVSDATPTPSGRSSFFACDVGFAFCCGSLRTDGGTSGFGAISANSSLIASLVLWVARLRSSSQFSSTNRLRRQNSRPL